MPLQHTFFLSIDGNRRLASGNRGFDRAVDMRELGVAIGVVAAFASLLVGLATILQIPQQVRHNALTGLEPLRRQRLDEVPQASNCSPAVMPAAIAM